MFSSLIDFLVFKILLIRNVLWPAFHGGVLAPTTEQRKRFGQEWLHIWGKEKLYIPARLAQLVKKYEVHNLIFLNFICA